MKTKSEVAAVIYVVLEALARAKTASLGGVPNGHLYAELMNDYNIDEWAAVVALITNNGFATEKNFLLKITPKGEDLKNKLDAIYQQVETKQTSHLPKP